MGTGERVETQTHERVRAHVHVHPLLASVFIVNPREERCEKATTNTNCSNQTGI